MFIGYFSSFLFSPMFSADISLYPAKKDMMQGLGQFQALAMNLGINKPKNDQDFNIPDVVRSRLIASKIINKKWTTSKGDATDLIEMWNFRKKDGTVFLSKNLLIQPEFMNRVLKN